MKKKNEKASQLVDEINKALGDKSKTSEIFYLLKKQGEISSRQKDEIIKLGKDLLENQRILKTYLNKYVDAFYFIKEGGDVSQLQQADIIELEKRILESHKATKEILSKLVDVAKSLKVILPKTFDVKVINSDDFPTEFRISNLDEIPSQLDEINIKQPQWLPDFFESAFKFITQPLIAVIKKQTQNITLIGPTDPSKAIAVRLSDGKRFYTAVLQAISAASSNSQKVEDLLQQIVNNTDTLELKTDQVNLNTDTLEAKLQTLIDGDKWERTTLVGKAYVVTTNAVVVSGTSEVAFLLLKNPASSGKTVRIKKILFGLENAGSFSTYRIYRDPTISANGATLTPINLLKGGSASVITAFRSPTISANGALMIADNLTSHNPDHDPDLGFIISQNENILLTVDPATTNMQHMVTIYYMEE